MNIIRQLLLMPLLAVAITAFSTDSAQAQTPARDEVFDGVRGFSM